MIDDKSDSAPRAVSGVALRISPERQDTLLLEFKTNHGPFRFTLTPRIALEVAEKIRDSSKSFKMASRDPYKE